MDTETATKSGNGKASREAAESALARLPKPVAAHGAETSPVAERRRRHQGPDAVAVPHALRRLAHAGRGLPLHRTRHPGDARRGRPHPGTGRQVHLGRRVLSPADRARRLHEAHRGREARPQEDRLPPPHGQRTLPLRPVRGAAAPHPRRPGLRGRGHPLVHLGRRLRRHRRAGRRSSSAPPGGRCWCRTSCSSCCS